MATKHRLAPFLGTMAAREAAGIPLDPLGGALESPYEPGYVYKVPAGVTSQTIEGATAQAAEAIQKQGGLEVVYSNLVSTRQSWLDTIKALISGFAASQGPGVYIEAFTQKDVVQPASKLVGIQGGSKMGLFDDIWGAATGPGGIFNSNSGINWNSLLNTGVGIAQQAFAPQLSAAPMPSGGGAVAIPTMASVPAIAGRVGAVVGRSFFTRFPNLATSIQGLRNAGQNVTRAKLYGVMKRFGPEFLVSGGLLTAAAVNELAVAGPGRRRMNPANSKALRRAARRIESFHRLCQTTDKLRTRRRR